MASHVAGSSVKELICVMLLVHSEFHVHAVCQSACLSIGNERVFRKTVESIKMMFRMMGQLCRRYHVLDADSTSPWERGNFCWGLGGTM